jgi:hypothetical protein
MARSARRHERSTDVVVRPQIFAVDCKIFEAGVNDLQLSAKNLRAGGIVKDPQLRHGPTGLAAGNGSERRDV